MAASLLKMLFRGSPGDIAFHLKQSHTKGPLLIIIIVNKMFFIRFSFFEVRFPSVVVAAESGGNLTIEVRNGAILNQLSQY